MNSPADLTLAEVLRALRNRKLSSRELVAESLARAASVNSHTNAFLRVDGDLAIAQATSADKDLEKGHVRGVLHGVPFGAKDMFHRSGVRSSYGADIDLPLPSVTASVLSRLDAAGAIQLGVLNMTAFAVGPTGHNKTTGNCRNPWDTSRITGGSSSGSAAAVASRTVYAALGSDTAGSIRIPAGLCGATGLKPTYGLVSRAGSMGLSFTLDVVGPIARTAEDCAIMMNVIAGQDPADPTTAHIAPIDFARDIDRSVRGMRIGVVMPTALEPIDPEIVDALATAQSAFAELGCELIPIKMPDLELYDAAAGMILACEGSALHAQLTRDSVHSYGTQMRVRLERGFAIPAPTYIDALRHRSTALQMFTAEVFAKTDTLLLPLTAIRTPRIDESDIESGANIDLVVRQLTRFTRPLNYLGLPSLAIPMGFDADGMPLSMQLVGRSFSEPGLLRLAHAYQSLCRWYEKKPPIIGPVSSSETPDVSP